MTLNLLSLLCPCAACKASKMRKQPSAQLVTLLTNIAGAVPIDISSGVRCEAHNKAVGGAPESQHLKGTAADLRYKDSAECYRIVRAAMMAGARFIEVATKHVHVDTRLNAHPQLVTGVSR